MSNVFLISDLHIGHESIPKFAGRMRGNITTVDEHDQWIIQQWNSVVTKRDLVWVLGDAVFDKKKLPLIKKLKGIKHLVLGNHDEFSLESYLPYFNKVSGFTKYKGMWLSHAPIHEQSLRGRLNIHGHVHHKTLPDERYLNVSVEAVNGVPMPLDVALRRKSLLPNGGCPIRIETQSDLD